MKAKTFFLICTIFIYVFLHIFSPSVVTSPVLAAELPRAQLDVAERHFTEAYRRLLTRNYWEALDYLDRALRANTYLIDYYLMRGLVMNRIGNYGSGRESLEYYLEVRPMDSTASRILSYAIAQRRSLQRIVSSAALSAQWRVSRVDLQGEFDLGHVRAFNTRGLGKAGMWGKSLYLADTLGDRVIYWKKSARGVGAIRVNRPAAMLPMGDDSFYIVTAGGEVYFFGAFTDDLTSLYADLRGVLENTSITDAAMISESEFVVADSVTREIAFYSLATLTGVPAPDTLADAPTTEQTGAWNPPDDEQAFFEPVAAAPYGEWLAVADRGRDKIFFLNLVNKREFFSVNVSRPRDVTWSALGELFVINEDGDLLRVVVDFRDERVEAVDTLESGVVNGWTLFSSSDGDMYCMDISASRLWKAVPMPDSILSMATFSVSAPTISLEENRESFLLDVAFMSPFKTYSSTSRLVSHAVWNNRTISAIAEWNEREDKKADIVLFHRPVPASAISPAINNVVVENGADIRMVLPSVWSSRSMALTNLIVDSTVDMTAEDLYAITLFCLNNGVELDVWARSVPTVELARAAGITGGVALFSLINQPDLSLPHARMRIRIPLPQDLSSSGFPSRSMLSMFLDVGFMQTRDWIPLWPDMLD